MKRTKIAPAYSEEYLEIERPQTLSDRKIENLIQEVLSGGMDKDITDKVYDDFRNLAHDYIFNSNFNVLKGIDAFDRVDITLGCTQFIDTIYMQEKDVQVLSGDYRYHERLNPKLMYSTPDYLVPYTPLIIAMPFPSIGAIHYNMEDILNDCLENEIEVHIDGAWVTCSHGIHFNFDHPAIVSVAISLSKGLGLGWNRVGLRWTKKKEPDAITIMNDFHMNNRALVMIANHFLRNLSKDYLWMTHGDRYYKVCNDFNLRATQSIHIAMRDGHPVGIAPLIRYLEEHGI